MTRLEDLRDSIGEIRHSAYSMTHSTGDWERDFEIGI